MEIKLHFIVILATKSNISQLILQVFGFAVWPSILHKRLQFVRICLLMFWNHCLQTVLKDGSISPFRIGQGVACARAFWGRKYTRMVLGQGRKYTRMVLARVARVTASSVHVVRGLICTRGQGPRLYTRNGFAVCTPLFLQLCILCAPCVQVVRFITMLFGHV